MNNGLITAADKYDDVKMEETAVMAPCFLVAQDLTAGSASEDNILWGQTTWISGHKNTEPSHLELSSYDVMDILVDQFMDTDTYPNLQVGRIISFGMMISILTTAPRH